MPIIRITTGTITTVLSSAALTSMTNNSQVLSGTINLATNDVGYRQADWELFVSAWSAAPTANTAIVGWMLDAADGTNFEDGGTSVTPVRSPDLIFTVRPFATAQYLRFLSDLPPGPFRVLLRNDGTTQTITNGTLKCKPRTEYF